MGYTDLLEYVKRSKEVGAANADNIRFKLTTFKNNELVLFRHKMCEDFDKGSISASFVLTKDGNIMRFQGLPNTIVKQDDIEFLLKDSKVHLTDTEPKSFYQKGKKIGSYDLGAAYIDYTDDHDEDVVLEQAGSLYIPLLRTDPEFRRKGFAAKLVSDASKCAAFNGYNVMYGIGSPLEDDFLFSGKSALDRVYCRRYIADAIKDYGEDYPYEATAELALFYRKLGFNIMPLGKQFLFRKITDKKSATQLDRAFLFSDVTLLEDDEFVLTK